MVSKAKTVGDLVGKNGKIFVKSNHGLCDAGWPAVSFTKRADAERLQKEYNSKNDILIYLGTGQEPTKKEHRKLILSIVTLDKSKILPTKSLLDPRIWRDIKKRYPKRWEHSFVPHKSYDAIDRNNNRRKYKDFLTPETTRQLGFGRAIEVAAHERAKLLKLEIGTDILTGEPE